MGAFVFRFWRARRDSNPQPLGPKPSTLSVELQAQTVGALVLGRATGFEPVISCATDRRLGPLGYARRTAIDWSMDLRPSYGSKKDDLLQERQPPVTVQTWDVGTPELSLITGGLDVVNKIQSINIRPFDTRTSLILDCYSLEHWPPFFARTIRSPAEMNKERISLAAFFARTIRSPAETNRERISPAAFFRPEYSFPRGNE